MPVAVVNRTGYPMQVDVELHGVGLQILGEPTKRVTLGQQENILSFPVRITSASGTVIVKVVAGTTMVDQETIAVRGISIRSTLPWIAGGLVVLYARGRLCGVVASALAGDGTGTQEGGACADLLLDRGTHRDLLAALTLERGMKGIISGILILAFWPSSWSMAWRSTWRIRRRTRSPAAPDSRRPPSTSRRGGNLNAAKQAAQDFADSKDTVLVSIEYHKADARYFTVRTQKMAQTYVLKHIPGMDKLLLQGLDGRRQFLTHSATVSPTSCAPAARSSC